MECYIVVLLLLYSGVRQMADLGKSLEWPTTSSPVLADFVSLLQLLHGR